MAPLDIVVSHTMEVAGAAEADRIAAQFVSLDNLPDENWRTVLEGNKK